MGSASFLFLLVAGFGSVHALSRKSQPEVLSGLGAEIVSKSVWFSDDATAGRTQLTHLRLRRVDLNLLRGRIEELEAKGKLVSSFMSDDTGKDLELIEIGPAKPMDYWVSYITTLGKPPQRTGALRLSIHSSAGSTIVIADSPKTLTPP